MNIITIDYNMCYVKGSLRNTMPIEKKIGSLSIKMFIKYQPTLLSYSKRK